MLGELLKKIKAVFWFLPGFLLWAAYPPMGEKADVLFALAPLMWLSRRADPLTSAKRWFQSGIFFWVATLAWMPAIVKNGGPWPLVALGWGVLSAYMAAYFAAYGYLAAKIWSWARRTYWRRILAMLVLEPVLWCGLELVRSRFLGGFAWNQLGVVCANSGFAAPAALGGVYLLSAVIVLINGSFAGIFERMFTPGGDRQIPRWARSAETLLVFALVYFVYSLAPSADNRETRPLKVAMVQRNFPCVFKNNDERAYEVYDRLLRNVSLLHPDVVVLGESALCEFGPVDQRGAYDFAAWIAEKTGAALIAGGTRYGDGNTYNSAALYVPSAAGGAATPVAVDVYDKVHLVPFGEYIPGDKLFPALQKLAPVGSCTPGELKVMEFNGVKLALAICFEDTDSAQMRRLAEMGAELLVFITNDSWFSHSDEARQHAWQAVARAVETSLPVVRVGNSGVTGTVSPDGRAVWLLDAGGGVLVDRPGTMFDKIDCPVKPAPTPYVRFGDKPLAIAFALLIAGMILVKYRNEYEQRRDLSL
jgi:apolipoprotein N-acyltransferase